MADAFPYIRGESNLRPLGERERIAVVVKAVVRAGRCLGADQRRGRVAVRRADSYLEPHEGRALQRNPRPRQGDTRKSDHRSVQRTPVVLFNGPLWPMAGRRLPIPDQVLTAGHRVQVMCDGGIPAMMKVRQHIDALRGGA